MQLNQLSQQIRMQVQSLIVKYSDQQQTNLLEKTKSILAIQLLEQLREIFLPSQLPGKILAEKLNQLLTTNWNIIKNTALCYTAQPDWDITLLMYDIANLTAELTKKNSLECLIPNVSLSSMHNDYKDLTALNNSGIKKYLNLICQSHILSDDGNYLLPIKLIEKWEPGVPEEKQQISNPYFNFSINNNNNGYLTTNEINRLFNHSDLTKLLKTKIENYATYLNDKDNLQGRLQILCNNLYFNSVNFLGEKAEEQAGIGAYDALHDFFAYYHALGQEQQNKIPVAVHTEINKLKNLASDPETNNNADDDNIETCIAGRRDDLKNAMFNYESELTKINLTEEDNSKQLVIIKNEYLAIKKIIGGSIAENNYNGQDPLLITPRLLNNLNIEFSIVTEDDLKYFFELTPNEIKDFLTDNSQLRDQLASQLTEPENIFMFFITTAPDKLAIILGSIGEKLFPIISNIKDTEEHYIDEEIKAEELIYILSLLTIEKRRIIAEGLFYNFPSIFSTIFILQYIPEYKKEIFNLAKTYLSEINNSGDFKETLKLLDHEQRQEFFALIKNKLSNMIKNLADVPNIIKYLNDQQIDEFFPTIMEIINNPDFLDPNNYISIGLLIITKDTLPLLNDAHCTEYFSAIMPTIIQAFRNSTYNDNYVFEVIFAIRDNLKETQAQIFIDEIKESLYNFNLQENDKLTIIEIGYVMLNTRTKQFFDLFNNDSNSNGYLLANFESLHDAINKLIRIGRNLDDRNIPILGTDYAKIMLELMNNINYNFADKLLEIQNNRAYRKAVNPGYKSMLSFLYKESDATRIENKIIKLIQELPSIMQEEQKRASYVI